MLRTILLNPVLCRILFGCVLLVSASTTQAQVFVPETPSQTSADSPTLDPELSDRRLQRVFDSAISLLERDDLVNALPLLQSILDHPRDAMYYLDPEDRDQAVSLKGKVLETIGQLSVTEKDQYQLLFEAAAEEILENAGTDLELTALEEVVRRYYFTEAGAKSARRLAELYFDRGNSLAAALTFQRLLSEKRIPRAERAGVLLQTCIALRMSGLNEECRNYLQQLQQETTTLSIRVRGESQNLSTSEATGVEWLDQIASIRPESLRAAKTEGWRMFGGDSQRNAVSHAAPPLREQSWEFRTIPLSEFGDPRQLELVESELRSLSRRFASTRYLQIPAMHPLLVDDVLVFRSLGNLKAIDVHSGEMLWETYSIDSEFEKLLLDTDTSSFSNNSQVSDLQAYIMQRTWRDMTSGTLSSDGEFVFAIEDQGLLEVNRSGSYSQKADYNKLMAYELSSGKAIWELGGSGDNFTTGLRFLGAPLVQGKILYCIVSRKDQMLLLALKNEELPSGRRTVRKLWEQPLPTPIASELEKQTPLWQLTGLSPSYANGILICPIAHGTVIGFDLARGIFSWQFRYSEDFSHSKQTLSKLDRLQSEYGISPEDENRWIDSAARVSQGHVIVTPCDSSEIYCLSLLDGTPYWSAPRESDLFVACIHERQVILVGRGEVHARDLDQGRKLWSVEIPGPSGKGYRSGDDYFLPLSNASIAVINLKTGTLKGTLPSAHDRVAGNLVAANGMVVSQTKDRIFRYMSDTELEAHKRELEPAPASVLQGELALLEGERSTAIEHFVSAYETEPNSRLHEMLTSSLMAGLQQNYEEYEQYLPLLQTLTAGTEKASLLQAVVAEGQIKAGNSSDAFDQLLGLIEQPEFMLNHREARIRSDMWVRARLQSIYKQADEKLQRSLRNRVSVLVDRLLQQNDPTLIARASTILNPLPGSQKIISQQTNQLDAYTDSLSLELKLIQLSQSDQEPLRREAIARHYRLLMKLQKIPEAASLREKLLNQYSDQICLDGMTGKDLAEWGLENRLLSDFLKMSQHPWTARPISVTSSQKISSWPTLHRIPDFGSREMWDGWSFCLATDRPPKLFGFDRLGQKRFEFALPVVQQNPNSLIADRRLYLHGHLAVLVFSDQFYVLDLFQDGEETVLHGPHDLKEPLVGFQRPSSRSSIQLERVVAPNGHPDQRVYDLFDEPLGTIALVNSEMIVYQKDRNLVAIDWRNGELLWEQQLGKHGQTFAADDDYIACLPANSQFVTVHRTSDGQQISQLKLSGIPQWVGRSGRTLIVWEQPEDPNANWKLSAYDVVSQNTLWTQTVPQGSLLQQPTPDTIGTLDPESREFRLIRSTTGEVLTSQTIEVDTASDEEPEILAFHLNRFRSGFLLTIREEPSEEDQPFVISADEYYFPQVNGEVIRFDGKGEVLWRQRVTNQAYDPDQAEASPLIVFLAKRRQARRGFISTPQENSIDLLDCETGDSLFSETNTKHLTRLRVQVRPEQNLVNLSGLRSLFTVKFGENPNSAPSVDE